MLGNQRKFSKQVTLYTVYNIYMCMYMHMYVNNVLPCSNLQASQGSYAVDSESPLYQAKLKYTDAVSSDPNDAIALYHLGRLCLLLGEPATDHLTAALSIKPTLSEARYCLGLATKNKVFLATGLGDYQRTIQEVNESQANPLRGEPRDLHSKVLYRSSNTLIVSKTLHFVHELTCT